MMGARHGERAWKIVVILGREGKRKKVEDKTFADMYEVHLRDTDVVHDATGTVEWICSKLIS